MPSKHFRGVTSDSADFSVDTSANDRQRQIKTIIRKLTQDIQRNTAVQLLTFSKKYFPAQWRTFYYAQPALQQLSRRKEGAEPKPSLRGRQKICLLSSCCVSTTLHYQGLRRMKMPGIEKLHLEDAFDDSPQVCH